MELKKTPFYEKHVERKARVVDFSGWALPLEYSSILEEVKQTRSHCGLFDASHMGQIRLRGEKSLEFLQKLVTNNLLSLGKGRMQYNLLLNHRGGVIDDLMVYNLEESYLCVVNASNVEKVFLWFKENKTEDVSIDNESKDTAMLCLQGPAACAVMEKVLCKKLDKVKYLQFIQEKIEGKEALISRSGYTGEDGFEIYVNSFDAVFWWDLITGIGKDFGLELCGLGARDILRIEAGYPLYGHEIDEEIDPYEACLSWAVKFNKDFIGKAELIKRKAKGIKRRRVGLVMEDRAVPRQGYPVYCRERAIGKVCSGTYSPTLDKFIAMAHLDVEFSYLNNSITVKIRDKNYKAKIVNFPFVEIRTYRDFQTLAVKNLRF